MLTCVKWFIRSAVFPLGQINDILVWLWSSESVPGCESLISSVCVKLLCSWYSICLHLNSVNCFRIFEVKQWLWEEETIFLSNCSLVSPGVKQKRSWIAIWWTIGTCADSYQQDKTVFPVDTILFGRETENVCHYTGFILEFSTFFGTLYRGGCPGRFSLSGRCKGSPHPSHWPR